MFIIIFLVLILYISSEGEDFYGNQKFKKWWIYFRDKPFKELSSHYSHINEKAISRRRMSLGISEVFDYRDLPVFSDYVDQVVDVLEGKISRIWVRSKWLNAISVIYPSQEEIEKILKLSFVERVKPVKKLSNPKISRSEGKSRISSFRRDNMWGVTYGQLEQIGITPLHERGLLGQGVTILVIDSGFDLSYDCFKSINVSHAWDFVKNDSEVGPEPGDKSDQSDHGTEVLSILAGYNPGVFVGSAPFATYILAKTEDLEREEQSEEDDFVAAVEWGEALGTDVLTTSLGYTEWYGDSDYNGQNSVVTRILDTVVEKGVVAVTSAGNGGGYDLSISIPSDAYFVISAGAVDSKGVIGDFSSHGPTLDNRIKPEVCARGVDTYTLEIRKETNGDVYKNHKGTSFAAPLVGGAAAILRQARPDWNPRRIRNAMMMTSSRSENPDNSYGWGVLNISKAMNYFSCPNECHLTPAEREKISYGYIYSCYLPNGGCGDHGRWICKAGHQGAYCDQEFVCEVGVNCAFSCVENECVREMGFFENVWLIIRILWFIFVVIVKVLLRL